MTEQDTRTVGDRRTAENPPTRPETEGTSGYGISITLIGGVLLALSYYTVTAFQGGELSGFALPEPFYLLAVAFLFVLELLKSRHKGLIALVRAGLFAAVFGTLCVLGVEGAIYLVGSPARALENYAGVTVLSVALVVSALAYFTYLSVVQFDRQKRIGG